MKEAKNSQSIEKSRSRETSGGPDSSLLTQEDLKVLKAPFSKERLGVKVQSFNRERTRALLVLYLQHTDVQDRLEEVDPAWTSEVIAEERAGDTVYVRSRMTVKGVTRENVGEGYDPKAAYSDALKRCAMLFGVGRYLYDSVTVWADYQEGRDKYRQWSVDDYEEAMKRIPASKRPPEVPLGVSPSSPGLTTSAQASQAIPAPKRASSKAAPKAGSASARATRPREELNRILMNLYRPYLAQFPETQFSEILQERYQVKETRLMTVEQLEDLVQHLEARLSSVA